MARLSFRFLLLVSLALLAPLTLAPLPVRGQDATPAATNSLPEGVTIVANGLDNPRAFTWADDGTLYLAIAGIGGPSAGMIEGSPSGLVGGPTASVVTLSDGCPTVVAGGLPSGLWEGVGWAWGTADVAFLDGTLYQLASGGGSDYGNFDTPAGVYTVNDDGSTTLVADFSAWSRENLATFVPPDFNADGSLYDMAAADGRLWITDAVSGRIITVTPDGQIALFHDYSEQHPVPTGIVPDGAGGLYVANLTAIPYPPGAAKVVHFAADGTVEDVWTGLRAVTSLAMGPDGAWYASELAAGALDEDPFLAPNTGRVVRQTGPDSVEAVVTDLPYPASIGFGPDGALYLTTPAFASGTGQGQGALVRIDPTTTLPVSFAGIDLSASTCASATATQPLATPMAQAEQTAATAVSTELMPLLRLSLSGETMDEGETLGLTRTTVDVGGSQQVSAGGGASVFFAETGMLSVIPADGSPAVRVSGGGGLDGAAPDEVAAGSEGTLNPGDALVMPAGSVAEIRNDTDAPATLLRLLAAGDAATDAETGVTRTVMVRDVDALASPGQLTLEQTTIPAGDQLAYPPAPAQAVVAGLDPGQATYLSMGSAGAATNRSPAPMAVYLLTLHPAE